MGHPTIRARARFQSHCHGWLQWWAAIIFKAKKGILVEGDAALELGPGMVNDKNDQFPMHLSTIEYEFIVVNVQGMNSCMGHHLDAVGYIADLHNTSVAVRYYLGDDK